MSEEKMDYPLRTTRAAALREYARALGATGFLDLKFSRCRTCDARRIAERVAQAAAGARRVGTLVGPRGRYEVYTRGTGLRPVRLLIGQAADGSRELLAADRRPPDSQPPAYLPELELFELEEEVKAMDVKIEWKSRAMTSREIDNKYADRHHLLYIPPLRRGSAVGEDPRR